MSGLIIKEMPVSVHLRPAAQQVVSATLPTVAGPELLYEAVWQVSDAPRFGAVLSIAPQHHTVLHARALRKNGNSPLDAAVYTAALPALSAHDQLCIDALSMQQEGGDQGIALAVAAAATAGLELLHRCLPHASTDAGLRVLTRGSSPATGSLCRKAGAHESAAAAGAALAAIMRVAATENPGIRVEGLDTALVGSPPAEQHGSQVTRHTGCCSSVLAVILCEPASGIAGTQPCFIQKFVCTGHRR